MAVEEGEKRPTLRLLRPGPVTREELRKFGRVVKAGPVTGNRPEAPGTLESHYAPGVPVLLFDRPEEFEPEEGRNYALLSYRGDPKDGYLERHEWSRVEVLSPGKGKLAEAAVRFFHSLRVLDTEGVDAIVAEPVSDVGLGSAIMDRLRRAAFRGDGNRWSRVWALNFGADSGMIDPDVAVDDDSVRAHPGESDSGVPEGCPDRQVRGDRAGGRCLRGGFPVS